MHLHANGIDQSKVREKHKDQQSIDMQKSNINERLSF